MSGGLCEPPQVTGSSLRGSRIGTGAVAAAIAIAFASVVTGSLVGCGDNSPPGESIPTPLEPDARADSALVELGSDDGGFVRLRPEQSLPLLEGIQGGHHFLFHVRLRGLDPGDPLRPGLPSNPATGFSVFDEAGERVNEATPPYRLGFDDESDGWSVWPNPRTTIIRPEHVSSLDGRRVRVRVDVTDSQQRSASDEVWVRAEVVPFGADAGVPLP